MTTPLEDLLADISSVARRPSEARVAVVPPKVKEIEISELDVVEELPDLVHKRLARGTEPAASEVGLIDLEPMRSAEYAEMAVTAQPAAPRRRRNLIGALLLVLSAAVGAGAMAAWPAVSQRFAGSADERDQAAPREPVEVARAMPAEQPAEPPVEQPVATDEDEFVAIDELEPGEIEINFPVMAIKPRSAASDNQVEAEAAPAPPPAPLSLDAPCYDPACAAMDEADDETDEGDAEEVEGEEGDVVAKEAETPAAPAAPTVDPRTLPARPYASVIASAIVAVQLQLDGCGDAFGTHGAVRIKLRISPAGRVESVTVLDGSGGFRTCVADAVRRVRVNASTLGATETLAIRVH